MKRGRKEMAKRKEKRQEKRQEKGREERNMITSRGMMSSLQLLTMRPMV